MVFLGFMEWIVVGLIVGFVASKMVNLRGDDPWLGIGVAVGGSVVFAALYSIIAGSAVHAWNPWCLLFAAAGGAVGALIWHGVRSRSISHDRYDPRRSY